MSARTSPTPLKMRGWGVLRFRINWKNKKFNLENPFIRLGDGGFGLRGPRASWEDT